ncbi:hypothetical protein DSO57_1032569 [Entomophthora muscae]|uniref:Uncharacterized protein n=1 Tax=Entomophthora muscae TaxID=34485 RepID=A0ACC2TMQ2_9FUNG|nr:hypothetical protein DSO57_1032569 [Entomophthora muscae]
MATVDIFSVDMGAVATNPPAAQPAPYKPSASHLLSQPGTSGPTASLLPAPHPPASTLPASHPPSQPPASLLPAHLLAPQVPVIY